MKLRRTKIVPFFGRVSQSMRRARVLEQTATITSFFCRLCLKKRNSVCVWDKANKRGRTGDKIIFIYSGG